VVTPTYRVVPRAKKSLGPDIVRFAQDHGVVLDDWQEDAVKAFSGVNGKKWAAPTGVLICPRQNGKSVVLILRVLYGLFVERRQMVLFSSHQWATSNEAFLAAKTIIESNDDLSEQVKTTSLSVAKLGFELHDGGRILFLTRSRAAARGFGGDLLVFDEAHFLSEAAHQALRPSLGGRSAVGNVQTLYGSSAADQLRHPDALVVARLRKRAIDGEPGIALVEYSADLRADDGHELLPSQVPPGVATDPDVIRKANPGCPKRISLDFLLEETVALDTRAYATEHLGVGDWPDTEGLASTVLDLKKWAERIDPTSTPVHPVGVGFDVSPDRRRGAVGIAGKRLDGLVHVELVASEAGVGWIPGFVRDFENKHDPYVIVCDASQSLLAEQVFDAGASRPELLDRQELAQGCARLVDLVEQDELRHLGDPVLLDAIRAAKTSSMGDGGFAFSRRTSHGDLSPLYAIVLALMALERMPAEMDEFAIY
jgi:hypothetical protein